MLLKAMNFFKRFCFIVTKEPMITEIIADTRNKNPNKFRSIFKRLKILVIKTKIVNFGIMAKKIVEDKGDPS